MATRKTIFVSRINFLRCPTRANRVRVCVFPSSPPLLLLLPDTSSFFAPRTKRADFDR